MRVASLYSRGKKKKFPTFLRNHSWGKDSRWSVVYFVVFSPSFAKVEWLPFNLEGGLHQASFAQLTWLISFLCIKWKTNCAVATISKSSDIMFRDIFASFLLCTAITR